MNVQKPIYRFFSACLIIAVFLATAVPSVVRGNGVVQKFCSTPSGEQPMSMPMNGLSSQQNIKTAIQRVDESNSDFSHTAGAYLCCLSESPVGTKAPPVSQTISKEVVSLTVVNVHQPTVTSRPVLALGRQFVEITASSPPLFLQNNSFLN